MTAKELKKYNLIITLGYAELESAQLPTLFGELAANDFTTAFEMWVYMMTTSSTRLNEKAISENLEQSVWNALSNQSEAKFKLHFGESPTAQKLVYQNCATAVQNGNQSFLVNLILASKIDAAGEILKFISANRTQNFDYGSKMKTIIEDVFSTYCAKHGTAVPSLNRKQTMLLLEYALKIKGPNKNLLVQRIKELQ